MEKAIVIDKRYTKQCDICMLINSEDKTTKWHLWKDGWQSEDDKYICGNCLDDLKKIREKCHNKIDDPTDKDLGLFKPWFVKEVPGLEEKFRREMF